MGEYEDTLKEIEQTFGLVPGFMKGIPPEQLVVEWPIMKKYVLGQSKVPEKYREFIGLSTAATMKCPYCQLFHLSAAKLRGATDEELAEVAYLSSFTARWSNMIHAQHYDYAKFRLEMEQIVAHLTKLMKKNQGASH